MKRLNITEGNSPLGHNSYYVQISRLELGDVIDVKWNGRWHDVYVEIVQGEYEIAAMQVERVGDMEFCTGDFFKGQKHTTAKINDGVIWMKVWEFPSGTKNKKKWIYENAGNKVVDTLKFYIYEENGKHRFLPENGEIEEGSVYIEPYVYGFTPITVKLDSRDISKKVNDGYGKVKKSFKESKMERKTMKKLNVTKERFEKSRYFQKKYGKLEYVSESGNLYKTDKGKVLMFKESSEHYSRRYFRDVIEELLRKTPNIGVKGYSLPRGHGDAALRIEDMNGNYYIISVIDDEEGPTWANSGVD